VSEWSVRTRAETRGRDDGDVSESTAAAGEFVIEDSLGYLVNRVARSIAHQLAEEIRPAGVAIGQWAVLLYLWASGGVSQADLSRLVGIEPPTMVRTIDRMVRDGLVTRVPDPGDGRVSRIHLTDRGRSLRDELVPKAVTVNATTLGVLSASEGRTLRRLLVKLLEGTGDGDSTSTDH
jgi:MarR family transcriptional regulator, organic hydroperoxide resistance regulator